MRRLKCWLVGHNFGKVIKFQEGFFENRRTVIIWECQCCKKREFQIIGMWGYRII